MRGNSRHMEPMDPNGDGEKLARLQGDALAILERMTAALASLADDLEAGSTTAPAEVRKTITLFSQAEITVLEKRNQLENVLGNQNGAGAELDLGAARREINSRLDCYLILKMFWICTVLFST